MTATTLIGQQGDASPSGSGTPLRYLELHLLWGDAGPVARVRLSNAGPIPLIELVHVFASHDGTARPVGHGRVRVPPRSAVDGLIELDRDFPTPGAWLHQDISGTPLRLWAGPTIHRPQVTADGH